MGIVVGNKEYNPRYVCYAFAHGKDPEEMLEYDWEHHRYMREFVIWNRNMLDEFMKAHPELYNWNAKGFDQDDKRYLAAAMFQTEYDKWLKETVGLKYEQLKSMV